MTTLPRKRKPMLNISQNEILEAFDDLDLSAAESFLRRAKAKIDQRRMEKFPRVKVEIMADSVKTAQVIANQILPASANYRVSSVSLYKQTNQNTWESVEVEVSPGVKVNPKIKLS